MPTLSKADDEATFLRRPTGNDTKAHFWAACHSAIIDWCKPQTDILAQKTIDGLKKQPAVGMFDQYGFVSFWDEYCHEVQNGPFVEELYETVDGFCLSVVDAVDRPTLRLLTIAAIEAESEDEDPAKADSVWPDLIVKVVMAGVNEVAGNRDLDPLTSFGDENDDEHDADDDDNDDDDQDDGEDDETETEEDEGADARTIIDMREDVPEYVGPERDDRGQAPKLPRGRGWHLNDNDLSVIDDLHATCVDWLQYAKDAQSTRGVADAMAALEAIAAGASVKPTIDVTVTHKPEDSDGFSATLIISQSSIVLSVVEWVFMSPAQGHDHSWRQVAELTARGGFDFDAVDRWRFLSEFATDAEKTELSTSKFE